MGVGDGRDRCSAVRRAGGWRGCWPTGPSKVGVGGRQVGLLNFRVSVCLRACMRVPACACLCVSVPV